jgi:hypothetical protein
MDEIIAQYPFRSIRSLTIWCRSVGVVVNNEDKIPYVYTFEFILAFHRDFIEKIKLKFPEKWSLYFDSIQNNDFSEFLKLNLESDIRIVNNSSYQRSNTVEQIKNELMNKKNKK